MKFPKNQLAAGVVSLVTIGVIAGVAVLAFLGARNHGNQDQPTDDGPAVAVVTPAEDRVLRGGLPELVDGIIATYLTQASGQSCGQDQEGKQQCHQMDTVVYAVGPDVADLARRIASNAQRSGWTTPEGGQPAVAPVAPENATAVEGASANVRNLEVFNSLTPLASGQPTYLIKDGRVALLRAYALEGAVDRADVDAMREVLQAELPGADAIDLDTAILNPLAADPTRSIVFVSVSEATQ
ncbi:hypothetical protein CR970_04295 [Candidatus Saccharibacteria bacterium]|nr:MAG: hypothetical protein CR970_04295 [Candidatus Saccharibacteria bacterium]